MGLSLSDLDEVDEKTWMDLLIIHLRRAAIQSGKIKPLPPKANQSQIDALFSKGKKSNG